MPDGSVWAGPHNIHRRPEFQQQALVFLPLWRPEAQGQRASSLYLWRGHSPDVQMATSSVLRRQKGQPPGLSSHKDTRPVGPGSHTHDFI